MRDENHTNISQIGSLVSHGYILRFIESQDPITIMGSCESEIIPKKTHPANVFWFILR